MLNKKLIQKNLELEQEKADIKSLEQKISRAEQSLANLKKKLEEEQNKTRQERESKNTLETDLREKKIFALEVEGKKNFRIKFKIKICTK